MRLNNMNGYLLIPTINLILTITIIIMINGTATAQNGFKIGLNISDYIVNETNVNWQSHNSIVGPYLGYFSDWNISYNSNNESYFTMGFEICLTEKGSLLKNLITYSELAPYEILDTSNVKKFFYYFELPHLVKFHYPISHRVKIEIECGGAVSLLVLYGTKTLENSNPNYSHNETHFFLSPNLGDTPDSFLDYSFVGGLGINYDNILFNVRYTRGLVKVYSFTSLQTLTFAIGYKFNE